MAIGTKDRPERVATDITGKGVKDAGDGGKAGKGGKAAKGGKKPKSKKMKIIALVGILVVGGAAAKFTVLAPSKASAAAAKPVAGPVVPMTDMTLNLTGGHFLRLTMAIETTKGTADDFDTSKAAQIVIDEYSNRSVAELTGVAARNKIKTELLAKIEKAYPKKVMDVFYTGFVMQ